MEESSSPKTNSSFRTIDVTPGHGELIKPAELIDIVGIDHLTLSTRKLYNLLLKNAFGPEIGEQGRKFQIRTTDLKSTHESNDRIRSDIVTLMRTIAVVRLDGGDIERRVQLLGTTDISRHGHIEYSFSDELVELLQKSTIFGKLETTVLLAFTSKYALALYEAVARRVRLKHIFMEEFPLGAFRELLGVPERKLRTFGNLNEYAIKPAVAEVNALASFGVRVQPKKQGRKVVGVTVAWWPKAMDELKAAYAEVNRPRVGRKARISGNVEEVVEPGTDQTQLALD